MKAIWDKFERQMAPVQKQLDRVRGIVPPQYGTLNEWTRARRKAAERAANGGGGGGGPDAAEDLEDSACSSTRSKRQSSR